MKNIPAARRREVLTRTKGKKAKNEILKVINGFNLVKILRRSMCFKLRL
jgi:hypothetical protein